MNTNSKTLMRQAIAIHGLLTTTKLSRPLAPLPTTLWDQCQRLMSQVRVAQQRGWQVAADNRQNLLRDTIWRLQAEQTAILLQFETRQANVLQPTVRDVYADLVALRSEFEQVEYKSSVRTLSVTTEAIELEGVYLGPFRIELDWDTREYEHRPRYQIIAVDANSAASNESVTHPHVQDEALCEGEGKVPIQKALEQGRLLDFFLIVATLLRTYNSSSPYVSLSEWGGVDCVDCGSNVSDDDRRGCEKCSEPLCDECSLCCEGCQYDYCSECITRCDGCDDRYCKSCLKDCSECGESFCNGCLNDQERCESCHDENTNEADSDELGACERPDGTIAAVHPDSLGQASVPA